MPAFRDVSIQRKLIAILMLASGFALVLACFGFVVYEVVLYRGELVREVATISQILSESSVAALAFNDPRAAGETLAVLKAEPQIVHGCISDRQGRLLAEYARPGGKASVRDTGATEGHYFREDRLHFFHPVVFDGERIGTVHVERVLAEMQQRLVRYAGIAGLVLLACSLASLAVASILQRLISRPILRLAETAEKVWRNKDYTLRAAKPGADEIGTLVDSFNEMMEQIKTRDSALLRAHDELEERVSERTKELQIEIAERKRAQEDLLAAKEAAEQSSHAKSTFLANMSHELRTPLNAVIGYSELLEEEAEEAGQPRFIPDVRRIQSAGRHLLTLINDVLDLSKIEAGRMVLHPELLEAVRVAEDMASTVEPLARKNNNEFRVGQDGRDGRVYADPTRLRQCLLNLLGNACKFTENGTVTLEVGQERSGGQDWTCFHIRDTGIGVSAEHRDKLFESFSQVDSSATRKYGGTGLGLSISQRLCQMMGGRITVDSELGKGSVFTIRLPAAASTAEELAKLDRGVGKAAGPSGIESVESAAAESLHRGCQDA